MGKVDLAVNMFKRASGCIRSGSSAILQSRPVNLEGLRLAPKVSGDVCTFKPDRTLCPKFLEDLLKIDDRDDVRFVTQVKDRILRAIGYSQPELLKVKKAENTAINMCFNFDSGELNLISFSNLAKEEKIALIRHELDHFDKAASLYKAVGPDEYLAALQKRFPFSEIKLNKTFWEQMSKDSNIEHFDAQKYLNGWKNWETIYYIDVGDINCLRANLAYINEPLEVSAYGLQKRVLRLFNQNDTVFADCAKPLGQMLDSLDKTGLSNFEKSGICIELSDAARFASVKDARLLMQNYKNIRAGNINEDLQKVIDTLPKEYSIPEGKKLYETIANWLNEGCYSIDDVLARGLF